VVAVRTSRRRFARWMARKTTGMSTSGSVGPSLKLETDFLQLCPPGSFGWR